MHDGDVRKMSIENSRAQAGPRPNGGGGRAEALTIEATEEFHRRMSSAIESVQAGIWQAGVHELLGYATDFGFGRDRGVQTLVLKTSRKSAYVRLQWHVVLGNGADDKQMVQDAIRSAITELS